MSRLIDFIQQDSRRFLIEIMAAILLFILGWIIGDMIDQKYLIDCQAENIELQKQHKVDQDFQHSVYYGQKLKEKDQQLRQKDEALLQLQEKHRLDSASILSLRESMAAINARYRSTNR